ncbi:MAG: hypothetical protein AB7S80_07450 [Rhizobiaceae bacterium]
MSFLAYLASRQSLPGPAGDFARRIAGDPDAPDFSDWAGIKAYLETALAPVVEIYAARECWLAYRRAVKRSAFK